VSGLTTALPPVLTVAFAVAAVLSVRSARAAQARLRRAVPAQGVVTQVEWNASQQVFPTVCFTTADQREVHAQPHSSSNAARFAVGQRVQLQYDPHDPAWIAVDGLPSMTSAGWVAGVVLGFVAVVLVAVTVLTR